MNGKLYDLMNWPKIEGVVYSECDKPYGLLGGSLCKDGFLIQVFRPDAVEVSVLVEGKKKTYVMEKVDEAGYFAVLIPVKKRVKYMVVVEDTKGKKTTYADPYAYEVSLDYDDVKRFNAGNCRDAYKFMGSHTMELCKVKGMHFAVWAPDAMRVSIVGDFNNWDGRILQMNRCYDNGIFELFVPGFEAKTPYCYEIKFKNGMIAKKLDPYACQIVRGDITSSVADVKPDYAWSDDKWLKKRDRDNIKRDRALSICEVSASECAKDIVSKVKKLGFNCVKLSGCFATVGGGCNAQVLSYYAVNDCFETPEALQELINSFHNSDIGVLVDWNTAYMAKSDMGLTYYDGMRLYESGEVRIAMHPDYCVSTFDYKKTQVRTFLYSNFSYLLNKFHIDGVVIDEVPSMIYLNYGRNAGEWSPNIYGGVENLDAIEYIKGLRKLISKHGGRPLLIAQDESAWPMVTGDISVDGLGFDYKLNEGWKRDFVDFIQADPLFRKGLYDKLSDSMLYQYSEDFILDLSHINGAVRSTVYDMAPGCSEDEECIKANKLANVKATLGFMYTRPGKKLVNINECSGIERYVEQLNAFYKDNPALYSLDGVSEGFEWIDNSSADETVVAYVRRATDGSELMAVVNFTPVERKEFKLGVTMPGKYTEVFNSDWSAANAKNVVATYNSVDEGWNYRQNSIAVDIPAMGVVVYAYTAYTDIELEEIQIRREAAKAKARADEEARRADEARRIAKERADEAKRAEEEAKKAAKEALEAQKKAERQADKAIKASRKIDEETKRKLEELLKDN